MTGKPAGARPNREGKPCMEDTQKVKAEPCIYCEHGPYCLTCPPPDVTDGPACSRCREEITRSEIAADPYYRGDDTEMFG